MVGARATERQEVAPRLQRAERRRQPSGVPRLLRCAVAQLVECLFHEAEAIRRVGHDGVKHPLDIAQDFYTVTVDYHG